MIRNNYSTLAVHFSDPTMEQEIDNKHDHNFAAGNLMHIVSNSLRSFAVYCPVIDNPLVNTHTVSGYD